jgi:hypothetical protein
LELSARQAGSTVTQSRTTASLRIKDLCDGVSLALDPSGPQPVGTDVTATATGSGCEEPLYSFDYRPAGGSWVKLSSGSSATPTVLVDTDGWLPGSYSLRVKVRARGTDFSQGRSIVGFELLP